jgi:outer membrane protein TolC
MALSKLKMASVFVLILVVISGTGVGAYHLYGQAPAPETDKPTAKGPEKEDDTLTTLMQERLKLAQQEMKACEKEYKSGKLHLDALVAASKNLLKAEIELSMKRADRFAARERHIKVMEAWVKNVQGWHQAGVASPAELLNAQYQLVDAKIDLEREKARK